MLSALAVTESKRIRSGTFRQKRAWKSPDGFAAIFVPRSLRTLEPGGPGASFSAPAKDLVLAWGRAVGGALASSQSSANCKQWRRLRVLLPGMPDSDHRLVAGVGGPAAVSIATLHALADLSESSLYRGQGSWNQAITILRQTEPPGGLPCDTTSLLEMALQATAELAHEQPLRLRALAMLLRPVYLPALARAARDAGAQGNGNVAPVGGQADRLRAMLRRRFGGVALVIPGREHKRRLAARRRLRRRKELFNSLRSVPAMALFEAGDDIGLIAPPRRSLSNARLWLNAPAICRWYAGERLLGIDALADASSRSARRELWGHQNSTPGIHVLVHYLRPGTPDSAIDHALRRVRMWRLTRPSLLREPSPTPLLRGDVPRLASDQR